MLFVEDRENGEFEAFEIQTMTASCPLSTPQPTSTASLESRKSSGARRYGKHRVVSKSAQVVSTIVYLQAHVASVLEGLQLLYGYMLD